MGIHVRAKTISSCSIRHKTTDSVLKILRRKHPHEKRDKLTNILLLLEVQPPLGQKERDHERLEHARASYQRARRTSNMLPKLDEPKTYLFKSNRCVSITNVVTDSGKPTLE